VKSLRLGMRVGEDTSVANPRRAFMSEAILPLHRGQVGDVLRLAGTALLIHKEKHSALVDQGVFDVSLVLPLLLVGEGVEGAGLVSLPRKEYWVLPLWTCFSRRSSTRNPSLTLSERFLET
jgi:hypothetical protein